MELWYENIKLNMKATEKGDIFDERFYFLTTVMILCYKSA